MKYAQNFHSYWNYGTTVTCALMHAQQVSWIGIKVFWNRKEDMRLYHIFKLYILSSGFDTTMFLPSLDPDYIGWKHQA